MDFVVFATKKQPTSNLDQLHKYDSLRYLYFLDSDYFESGEPVGKFIPTVILTPSSASESPSESLSKCPEETSYLGAFIAFAVIDFLLMLGLLGLGFLIWFGSKKMKKLRHIQNQRRGKKESSVYGVTSATTIAPTAQPSAVQPSAAVGSGASVAPTDLNTQVTTTKKVTTYENATKNGKTAVTK
uniref:Uncharacterized protein n=1 Tax=Panagrolaimus davidi TaxID=227884 RepID=A0A914Q5D3_9BILA